jgi:hypothetical protein
MRNIKKVNKKWWVKSERRDDAISFASYRQSSLFFFVVYCRCSVALKELEFEHNLRACDSCSNSNAAEG